VCDLYYKHGQKLPPGLMDDVRANVATLETELGKKFGDARMPLLVSVRSGAAASMPGMMNTILNLGLNDEAVVGLANATGNERFAYDSYRRLINMFGDVVVGVDHEHFEQAFDKIKRKKPKLVEIGFIELAQKRIKSLIVYFAVARCHIIKRLAVRIRYRFQMVGKQRETADVPIVFGEWDRGLKENFYLLVHFVRTLSRHGQLLEKQIVRVTKAPILPGFERSYDRMMPGIVMLRGVAIRRVVATADMPARHTNTQVYPRPADLKAVFAAFRTRFDVSNFRNMFAAFHFMQLPPPPVLFL
jgi:hypothetical protein